MLDFDSLRRDRAHTLDCLRVFSLHSGQGKQGSCALPAGDSKGSLGGVCTTSGLSLKVPGRVGDSPLIGHGLYVDNTAGAA